MWNVKELMCVGYHSHTTMNVLSCLAYHLHISIGLTHSRACKVFP